MAEFFDTICRTLATPMPRSRALKLILGGLASAALAPFAFGDECPAPGRDVCGRVPNKPNQVACCPPGQHCCLTDPNSISKPVCCGETQPCNNGACGKPSDTQP